MAGSDLSEELSESGKALLRATDSLAMQAQAAMWVYDHALGEWRYYLVSALVDSLGRRKIYRMLLDAFEMMNLPINMTIEDVHLASPTEPFFQFVGSFVNVEGNSDVSFQNYIYNGVAFDGLIYRFERDAPSSQSARDTGKRFSKRVKELVTHADRPSVDAAE